MYSEDPRIDPRTAPIFSSEVYQPYARRVISAIFWIFLIVVVVIFFSGWLTSSNTKDEDLEGEKIVLVNPEVSDPEPEPKTIHNGIYNFFYSMFSGMEDGIEDSPNNLKNIESLDDMNLDKKNIDSSLIEEMEPVVGDVEEHTNYFDGKILDYEGHVAGDISAIRYDDGEVKGFDFVLKEDLTPLDKRRRYTVPEDQVKVVENEDGFFIQLNKEQTRALAAELYDDVD